MPSKTFEDVLKNSEGILLDIACGANKQPPVAGQEWVGMDIQKLAGVNVVHDINIHPWPFPDECVRRSLASHIIEHIPPVVVEQGRTRFLLIEFMDEVWRITKPEGQLAIAYPHGSSQGFLQDPTHCHAMNESIWLYFDPLNEHCGKFLYSFYKPKPWKIEVLNWSPAGNVEVVLSKRREDASYNE